ncbi:hypothetical protein GGR53DRAFT_8271 [Hypoxylon sp. FL1150]|nr:hypothetical protein GGR53DRAFT_8271 [Hypoxylon sp. FL1150]
MRNGDIQNRQSGGSRLLSSMSAGVIVVSRMTLAPEGSQKWVAESIFEAHDSIERVSPSTAADLEEALEQSWRLGRVLSRTYLNEATSHETLSVLNGTKTQILSTPDPYKPKEHFLVYQSYFPVRGNADEQLRFLQELETALISDFESQRGELRVNWGAIVTAGRPPRQVHT